MRISDWSSDVCSSDLLGQRVDGIVGEHQRHILGLQQGDILLQQAGLRLGQDALEIVAGQALQLDADRQAALQFGRSEEHTSELQSLMRISYAVFCLKKKKKSIRCK